MVWTYRLSSGCPSAMSVLVSVSEGFGGSRSYGSGAVGRSSDIDRSLLCRRRVVPDVLGIPSPAPARLGNPSGHRYVTAPDGTGPLPANHGDRAGEAGPMREDRDMYADPELLWTQA